MNQHWDGTQWKLIPSPPAGINPHLPPLLLTTSPFGSPTLEFSDWPAGLSGLALYTQVAIQDAAAVQGVALSNALKADVP